MLISWNILRTITDLTVFPTIAVRCLPWLAALPARTSPDRPCQLPWDHGFPEKGSREAPRGEEPRWPPWLYRCVPGRDGKGEIFPGFSESPWNPGTVQQFEASSQYKWDIINILSKTYLNNIQCVSKVLHFSLFSWNYSYSCSQRDKTFSSNVIHWIFVVTVTLLY